MSERMKSIGGAANATSLTPHKVKDPLDFIRDFVLNHVKPEVALGVVFMGVHKQAQQLSDMLIPSIEDLPEEDRVNYEAIKLDYQQHKAAGEEFLKKYFETYPQNEVKNG